MIHNYCRPGSISVNIDAIKYASVDGMVKLRPKITQIGYPAVEARSKGSRPPPHPCARATKNSCFRKQVREQVRDDDQNVRNAQPC